MSGFECSIYFFNCSLMELRSFKREILIDSTAVVYSQNLLLSETFTLESRNVIVLFSTGWRSSIWTYVIVQKVNCYINLAPLLQ